MKDGIANDCKIKMEAIGNCDVAGVKYGPKERFTVASAESRDFLIAKGFARIVRETTEILSFTHEAQSPSTPTTKPKVDKDGTKGKRLSRRSR